MLTILLSKMPKEIVNTNKIYRINIKTIIDQTLV